MTQEAGDAMAAAQVLRELTPEGVLVATLMWRRREFVLGNLAGTAMIFGMAIVLISSPGWISCG